MKKKVKTFLKLKNQCTVSPSNNDIINIYQEQDDSFSSLAKEQTGIILTLDKGEAKKRGAELIKPSTRSLFQTIERSF